MSRSVTLFTGQWADLSINELAPLAKEMGYDGLELACWGDHFDVDQAREEILQRKMGATRRPRARASPLHLVGQAIDNIDERHNDLTSRVWGDGKPEGVFVGSCRN